MTGAKRATPLHLFTIPPAINYLGLGATTAMAFWKGGWRERVIVTPIVLSSLLNNYLCRRVECWAGRLIAEDVLVLAITVIAAARGTRYWVLAVASVNLLYLLTDIVGPLYSPISRWAWLSADVMWEWLTYGILIWGSLTTARDRGRAQPA